MKRFSDRRDLVLINPGNRHQVYQGLGANVSAIEPPFLIAVLAAYLMRAGYSVAIIDANAENIAPDEVAERVAVYEPFLAVIVVYGSQPSASTQNMAVAGKICSAIKERTPCPVAMGGLHPSALPRRTLMEEAVDYVIEGEGFRTIEALVAVLKGPGNNVSTVPGLWRWCDGKVCHTPPPPLIDNLDSLPLVAAWDHLPMEKYRAHNWHCFDNLSARTPYGAIYTSLGCPFNCLFCCINAPFGRPTIRYRSPDKVVSEIELLVSRYGIRNLKIVDELFILDERHYMGIVDRLILKGLDLNIWAYARVDTVKLKNLRKMKQAGINWLALGIESASPEVRAQAEKCMRVRDIKEVVKSIRDAGIRVIGNYIFGLPQDTMVTMGETLDMALELNCEFANFYCAMAYPGSRLYEIALERGWELPASWIGYSQHAYETLPLPTEHLTASEVLKFRDDAFQIYFTNPLYLQMIEDTFGGHVRKHMEEITSRQLKRKILEKPAD